MTDLAFTPYTGQPDASGISDGLVASELLVRVLQLERVKRINALRDSFLAPEVLADTIKWGWYETTSVVVRTTIETSRILRLQRRVDHKEERAVSSHGHVGMTTRGEFVILEVDMHERWWMTIDFLHPEQGAFDPMGTETAKRELYLEMVEKMFSSFSYAYSMS